MRLLKNVYLSYWFFIVLIAIALLFVTTFAFPGLFFIAQIILVGFSAIVLIEIILLFLNKEPLSGERVVFNPMSLGDENKINIIVKSNYSFPVRVIVVDNAPYQLQMRDLMFPFFILPQQSKKISYNVIPNERGAYEFGNIYTYSSAFLHLIQRKHTIKAKEIVVVHPSILQMKKMELKVFAKTAMSGIKKIRRLGHNNEFEQIKNYVQGDDFRTVNWKATARKNELMVNQYQDERAQNVYSIIDKSRSMRMPFNHLTLLDYAINSTLAFSNIVLRKGDKVGLLTFSDKLGSILSAERKTSQLSKIMQLLYNQKTRFLEANYELLYQAVRKNIKGRSLIMLYTNIETEYTLKRVLPYLKNINQKHVLVVIFFVNTEVEKELHVVPTNIKEIYTKIFAEKYHLDQKKIAFELRKNGIQTILTKPESLSINTINKYLELKSKGII